MPTLSAGELDVAYDDVGAGPPLVLVHGGLGDRAMWAPQVRALSATHRCLAYDLRGHGGTRGGEGVAAFTPRLLRDDLLAFADALGLARFSLLGLSVGGFAAQEVAIAASERLDALVLADTWMVTAATPRVREAGRIAAPVVEGALRLLGTRPLAALAARAIGEGEEARELVRAATAGTSSESAVRVWRGLAAHDTTGRLGAIAAPTLVLAGERDGNLAQARRMAAEIPGARLEVLAGAGHITNLQAPAAFTAAVAGFLAQSAGGAGR